MVAAVVGLFEFLDDEGVSHIMGVLDHEGVVARRVRVVPAAPRFAGGEDHQDGEPHLSERSFAAAAPVARGSRTQKRLF